MKRLNHFSKELTKSKAIVAIFFAAVLLAAFPFSKSFSNNLTISGMTLDQPNKLVTFNISWQNSWRKSDWTAKNWDAAWVFVKWRDCSAAYTVQFTHGHVSETVSDHTFGGTTILEPTKRDGTAGIDASPDNSGVMLRRATDISTGTVSATVTLKINDMPTTGSLDFRIFGIEMVFVPQSSYVLGDGDGYISSSNSFSSTPNPSQPNIYSKVIASEANQIISESATSFCTAGNISGNCELTPAFQKGFAAFYIMKYEISQGQYTDFLNTINTAAQLTHYPNQSGNRMAIVNNITQPTPYFGYRPDRACNYLSWINFSAYVEWAALRPLTEMEYEKTCRGTEPAIPYQKAWGTTTGIIPLISGISGAETGTETITTSGANVNVTSLLWTSGDANSIAGPLRCGIFATGATTSRVQTGMGFYGAMDLSGNVSEYYISVAAGISTGPSAAGAALGDGTLNVANGNHQISSWPTAVSPSTYIIRRGGSWSSGAVSTATSTDTNISYRASGSTATSDNQSGGRGGR